jgi:hypothetical protein
MVEIQAVFYILHAAFFMQGASLHHPADQAASLNIAAAGPY